MNLLFGINPVASGVAGHEIEQTPLPKRTFKATQSSLVDFQQLFLL
jgi:hypothetical protein